MSGIILPGHQQPRGGVTLYVPSGYETPAQPLEEQGGHICRVLINAETNAICGKVFRPEQERQYLQHLRQCVSDHRDVIHAASVRTKLPWLDPNAWDPEIEEHMRKVGDRMRAEGRLEVKPSERAGF